MRTWTRKGAEATGCRRGSKPGRGRNPPAAAGRRPGPVGPRMISHCPEIAPSPVFPITNGARSDICRLALLPVRMSSRSPFSDGCARCNVSHNDTSRALTLARNLPVGPDVKRCSCHLHGSPSTSAVNGHIFAAEDLPLYDHRCPSTTHAVRGASKDSVGAIRRVDIVILPLGG